MRNRSPRSMSRLSPGLYRRINTYAVAAAGVGTLALSQAADARIVYTPAHVKIVPNHGEILFDVNHDGVKDFGFYALTSQTTSGFQALLNVGPAKAQQGNGILSVKSGRHTCAAALPKGVKVGPAKHFDSNNVLMAFVSSTAGGKGTSICPWAGLNKTAYLGLKLTIMGKTHFGWARVSVGYLTGYAYETIAGKAILTGATKGPEDAEPSSLNTPAPATLGALALGAPGLGIWKREDSLVTTP